MQFDKVVRRINVLVGWLKLRWFVHMADFALLRVTSYVMVGNRLNQIALYFILSMATWSK